eukprot:TRINITY_DN3254_c0_g1_i1.p1 TRINITY_DN3254_c0_g1~~TRINITY_DN3254_c0_g1_i1.p1  ORF type:complete len:707 (-),score=128.67 TRINITY_DN3254_c0_g1_i1:275-2395(-)
MLKSSFAHLQLLRKGTIDASNYKFHSCRIPVASLCSAESSEHVCAYAIPCVRLNCRAYLFENGLRRGNRDRGRHVFSFSAVEKKNVAIPSTKESELEDKTISVEKQEVCQNDGVVKDEAFPSGEFDYKPLQGWSLFIVKLKMLFALPWERVKKGSILHMKLKGKISDQLQMRFSSGLSLPTICDNFIKAAYDPRIAGVYLHIEPLTCGWGKIEEIRRHILNFKKSGKFIVGYISFCGEREYYLASACEELYAPPSAYIRLYGLKVQAQFLGGVFEKVGIQPQVQRIGKYKSVGDTLSRKNLSDENREMLTKILENTYDNWIQNLASTLGKTKESIEEVVDKGVYKVETLKQEGWLTNIKYDDEVLMMLKERLGQDLNKRLQVVDYRKYSRVRKWTLGLSGGRDCIAVIRASGSITRTRSNIPMSGIVSEKFIEKIRQVRESKRYKAVILRIDSPGGDALASDLLWREIQLLASTKPVVASMVDVAASGGYYMAMGAGVIIAENLTLTGSIGVVTAKLNLNKLYERIGLNKEVISKGRFAGLDDEQRPFRPDEEELFAKSAQNAYEQFRNKAAFSRSMNIDQMESVAQGRVWTGRDAVSNGLVDAIGGFSRAVAIAKMKANIPLDKKVKLVEVSRRPASFSEFFNIISAFMSGVSSFHFDIVLKPLSQELFQNGVQARMENIFLHYLWEGSEGEGLVEMLRNYLSSL